MVLHASEEAAGFWASSCGENSTKLLQNITNEYEREGIDRDAGWIAVFAGRKGQIAPAFFKNVSPSIGRKRFDKSDHFPPYVSVLDFRKRGD